MKFTSEYLMKAMGLSVGDRIKVEDVLYTINNLYILESFVNATSQPFAHYDCVHISILVRDNVEYEILPRPKRVGDLKCDDIPHSNCITCPIKILCLDYGDANKQLFYEILEDYKSKSGEHFDQEIHDLLKARLDKEVE